MDEKLKKAIQVLVFQTPVIGVAGTYWAGYLKNPIPAALITIAYELILLLWNNIGKPVWEAVWEQDLKQKTVNGLSIWLKATVQNLISGFGKQYLQQIIYENRMFGMHGLLIRRDSGRARWIEHVFVELQIAPTNAFQVSANPTEFKSLPGSQPIWSFLKRFKKQEAVALAVLGPPGCGKTSLMKHIALVYAAKKHRRHRLNARIPILLYLREHAKFIAESSPKLPDLVQQQYSDAKRYPELNPPPYWFSRQLTTGSCLIMLDGLDEVDETHRAAVSAWVDCQIRTYPKCRFILTSRPQGYQKAQLDRAYVFEVLPFTPEQAHLFIRNWYLANKMIDYGHDDAGVRQEAHRDADDLIQRLEDEKHRQLKILTVNPLLLTMIVNVHNYRPLPEKRVELYSEICNVMLGHWRKAIGVAEKLTYEQKRAVLEPLAEDMMNREIREIETQDAMTVMMPHLEQIGVEQAEKDGFLLSVQSGSGLMVEREAGQWGFAHLTFQEYLCASRWCKTGQAASWDAPKWQSMIAKPWWHETLRLYAAQADANMLVKACMELDTAPALKLAGNIAKEALRLDNALKESVTLILTERSVIRLRKEPITADDDFKKIFGLNENQRPLEYIQNNFKDNGDGTITDNATGLMWQQSGSPDEIYLKDVQAYIDELNNKKFAGYSDWRLPTVDELKSLLMPEKQSNDLYINPIFDEKQRWCWTSDKRASGGAWGVDFDGGNVYWGDGNVSYVRAVRSRQ